MGLSISLKCFWNRLPIYSGMTKTPEYKSLTTPQFRADLFQIAWLFSSKLLRFQPSDLDCGEQELTEFDSLQGFHRCDDYQ